MKSKKFKKDSNTKIDQMNHHPKNDCQILSKKLSTEKTKQKVSKYFQFMEF